MLSRLYAVCDADVCARAGWTLRDFAAACIDGGATLLQIRAKHVPSRTLLADADTLVARAAAAGAIIIINDRADIAHLSGAAGVHVGQDDVPPSAARAIVGSSAIVGLSTHTLGQLTDAVAEPVDYIAIGPVFATRTKATGYDAGGLQLVQQAADTARSRQLPIVAIGGITLDRAPDVIAAGATSVAVITDLLVANDPTARVRAYLERLSRI